MKHVNPLVFICILLMLPSTGSAQTCRVHCPDGSSVVQSCDDNSDPCGGGPSGGYNPPSYDYDAARRAQEAEAAAEAERQRQAEADRIERERLAEEKRQKDAEFIRNRDATASTLKGSIGTTVSPNDGGLKGSNTIDTGLKELHGNDRTARDVQGPQAAWKQLHCAAALSGYAFAAVKQATPDYQESSFLLAQASNALNGEPMGVECPATPPFPAQSGQGVAMDQVKDKERKILSRAVALVERMKQRSEPAAKPAEASKTSAETPEEKLRRTQRELNQANSQKITGKTKAEIDQHERDRKELAKLILANEQLEKGELTSVSVGIDENKDAPRMRKKSMSAPKKPVSAP